MMFEDLTFYFNHRILHQSWIYPSIHKIHHEHKSTFSLASLHAHPIEYLFGNVLPTTVGPLILGHRIHRAAVIGWLFVRAFESLDGHCGYNFPWSPFRLLPF
jgi:sterol desaturase/sphingolipid hydroxylase (fatty acid hydroxylase superfamily)